VLGNLCPAPRSVNMPGMALQADGRIILAGAVDCGSGSPAVTLVRYNTDGSLDPTFGTGGVVFGPSPAGASAVAVQPDGRIVTAGGGEAGGFLATRFNADGTLDSGFGSEGTVVVPVGEVGFDSQANAILVQPDGKIVVAGGTLLSRYDFAIARLETDGSLDRTFGHAGSGITTTDFHGDRDSIRALVLQPDGLIVAAGFAVAGKPRLEHFALARYKPGGALDRSFGEQGLATVEIEGSLAEDGARGLALQPDGRLVAAGSVTFCATGTCVKTGYAVARFLP
jgi:uncharacterized delta-60 repeat protein